MTFDPKRIAAEAAQSPLFSPIPADLAVAVVSDVFRAAGRAPPSDDDWARLTRDKHDLWEEQVAMLAYLLANTSLRAASVEALQARAADATTCLEYFFDAIRPLTGEMIRANAFRQEEVVRKWADALGGRIDGESPKESKKRMDQLDYRKALAEYERAEKVRAKEADKRAKALKEAQEREAAARAWRE